jgi:hypothetical protein
MIDQLRRRIIELMGVMSEPYEEYYTHENAEMWKWNYPLTKYANEKLVICHVGEDQNQSYIDCLKKIIDLLEEKDRKGELIIDRTRPIWRTLDDTSKRFFENLYVQHKEIALWSYRKLYEGDLSPNEVFNKTNEMLIEKGLSVKMERESFLYLPF